MLGAQASQEQFDKIMSYLEIGKKEGAKVLTGGDRKTLTGDLKDGYYIQPTVLRATTRCGFSRRKSSVLSFLSPPSRQWRKRSKSPMTRFTVSAQASGAVTPISLTAPGGASKRVACGRIAITSIRRVLRLVVTSSPASVETHKMMLDHYQQTKNLLVSYSPNKVGFF